jgi:hypothetical protein
MQALPETEDSDPVTAGSSVDDAAKKKKKKSKKVTDGSEETDGTAAGGEKMDMDTLCKSIAHLSATSTPGPVVETLVQRSKTADIAAEHAFWGTQPMRRPDGEDVDILSTYFTFAHALPRYRQYRSNH